MSSIKLISIFKSITIEDMLKKYSWLFLLVIILGGFFVRLYRFNNPIADWHSWRQTDTSAVSIFLVQDNYDVLHPRFYDLSNIPSGINNPQGLRFVEFPIFNLLQAGSYDLFGVLPIEQWGRLVTIFGSLASMFFLYKLVRKHVDPIAGFTTAFFFAFLPFSIYYGRTILPDQLMVTATLGGIYFFDLWIEKNSQLKTHNSKLKFQSYLFYFLSLLFTSSALLLKPYAIFFLLPIVYLAYRKFENKMFLKWEMWVFGILAIAPLAAWRWWLTQFPEGVPVSNWLFNEGNVRFKPFWLRWILFERLTKLILGYSGVIFVLLGLLKQKKEKEYWFMAPFILGSILYIFIIARGNLQHDYYQILIIPTICILLGRGVSFILSFKFYKPVLMSSVILITSSMLYFSWTNVKGYFNINNSYLVEAGNQADKLLPQDALVIAPYDGDTSLLYYTKRQGWPAFQNSIEELTEMGANYLVLQNPSESDIQGFTARYKTVASNSAVLIVELK